MASLSSGSEIGIRLLRPRKSHKPISEFWPRCCAMTTGTGNPSGNPESNVCSAFSPPMEVPTTTISNSCLKCYSCSSSVLSMTLHHLSIQLVTIIQRLVKRDPRRKFQRLLVTESKDAKHAQTVVKQIMNARLQILVEIDHHIATEDYLKLVEGTVGSKIVFGKHHVALKG